MARGGVGCTSEVPMDALKALAEVESPPRQAVAGVGEGAIVLHRTPSSSSQPPPPSISTEDGADQQELEALAFEDGSDDDEEKWCPACDRSSIDGKCWVFTSEPVKWALPNKRGVYCAPCFNVWRHVIKGKYSLGMLTVLLKRNAPLKATFRFACIVYAMMQREEPDKRIKKTTLLARIASCQWMLDQLGLPTWLKDYAVVLLEQLPPDQDNVVDADRLVSMFVDGQLRVGYLAPRSSLEPHLNGPITFLRTQPQQRSFVKIPFTDTGIATTESARDTKILSTKCLPVLGDDSPMLVPLQDAASSGDRNDGIPSSFAALKVGVTESLQVWTDEAWPECAKEAPITKIANRAVLLKQELVMGGASNSILEALESLVIGLCSGRTFTKNYRFYKRVKTPCCSKTAALHEHLGPFHTFLVSILQRPNVSQTLTCLMLKAAFCKALVDDGDLFLAWGAVKGEVLDAGPDRCFLEVREHSECQQSGRLSMDIWMRTVFFRGFEYVVDSVSAADTEDGKDMQETRRASAKSLEAIVLDIPNNACPETHYDLQQTVRCLNADLPTSKIREVKEASTHIMTVARCVVLKQAFEETLAGQSWWQSVDILLSANAEDELGEKVFKNVLELVVGNAELPQVQTQTREHVEIVNCASFQIGLAWHILYDGASRCGEADRLCSPARVVYMTEELQTCAKGFAVAFKLNDCYTLCRLRGFEEFLESAHATVEGVCNLVNSDGAIDTTTFQTINFQKMMRLLQDVLPAPENNEIKAKVAKLIESMRGARPNSLKAALSTQELLDAAEATTTLDAWVRAFQMWVTALEGFRSAPAAHGMTLQSVVDAWLPAEACLDSEKNLLHVALDVVKASSALTAVEFNALDALKCICSEPEALKTIEFKDAPSVGDMEWSCVDDFVGNVADHALVRLSEKLVAQAVQTVVESFHENLRIEAMNFPAAEDIVEKGVQSAAPIADLFRHVLDVAKMGVSIAQASRYVHSSSESASDAVNFLQLSQSHSLLTDLTAAVDAEDLSTIDLSTFVLNDGTSVVDKTAAVAMLSLYRDMGIVAGLVGYLSKFDGTGAATPCIVKDNSIAVDILKALRFLDEWLDMLMKKVADEEMQKLFAVSNCWRLSVLTVRSWARNVESLSFAVKDHVYSKLLEAAHRTAQDLVSRTPKYGHFVNGSSYHPVMARRHLVNYSFTDTLNTLSIAAYKFLGSLSTLHTIFGFDGEFATSEATKTEYAFINNAFDDAKKWTTTRAAVVVLQDQSGKEQVDNATSLLHAKVVNLLPGALVPLLTAAVKNKGKKLLKKRREDEDDSDAAVAATTATTSGGGGKKRPRRMSSAEAQF